MSFLKIKKKKKTVFKKRFKKTLSNGPLIIDD